MRNLRQPPVMMLFNSLSAADVGLYNDYNLGKKVMTFKKLGVNIVGDDVSGSASSPAIPASSGTLASNIRVSKSCTDDGKRQAVELKFAPPAPCEACDWEYYLTLREKVKMPGVGNSKDNLQQKSYTGVLEAIEATGTTVDDTYVLQMEDDFLDQITNDVGAHNINNDPETKMSGAIVNAHRIYYVTINGANTDKLKITSEDGDTETIDLDTGTTIVTAIHDFNTDNSYNLAAIAISSTQMMIIGPAGYKYTIENGGGATTITTIERKLLLISKSEKVQFDVKFPKGYATVRGVYLNAIDVSTTTTTRINTVIDGTETETNDGEASATALVTAYNADFSGEVYASILTSSSTVMYVYSNADLLDSLEMSFDATSTLAWNTATSELWGTVFSKYSPRGRYPSYTWEDIYRMFFNKGDMGSLARLMPLEKPEKDTDYCVYTITVKNQEISALHGPSYNTSFETEYIIVVKQSIVDTDYWDATNPAGTGARYSYMQESTDTLVAPWTVDTNFEELLGDLVGAEVSTW